MLTILTYPANVSNTVRGNKLYEPIYDIVPDCDAEKT